MSKAKYNKDNIQTVNDKGEVVRLDGHDHYNIPGAAGEFTLSEATLKKNPALKDNKYWLKVDKETNNIEIWRKKGGLDARLGTMTADGKNFTGNNDFASINKANAEEVKALAGPEARQNIRDQAEKTVEHGRRKELIDQGVDPTEAAQQAQTEARDRINSNDALPGSEAAAEADKKLLEEEINQAQERKKYEDLMYPLDLNSELQDFMIFDLVEYKPRQYSDQAMNGGGGVGSRKNIGLQQRKAGSRGGFGLGGERKILASVTLPIPAGIMDQNMVDWNTGEMDLLTQNMAGLAGNMIEGDAAGTGASLNQMGEAVTSGSAAGQIKVGLINSALKGADYAKRQYGLAVNKNLELLFNGPKLRNFTFNFRLSPREKKEAEQIKKIIRLFKQGMSPKKGKTFSFIKAPHTFFISYFHKGTTSPWLNMFKECALDGLSMNYTPDGQYSTFYDGPMTSYQMQLTFKELEPVFDSDYTDIDGDADAWIGY